MENENLNVNQMTTLATEQIQPLEEQKPMKWTIRKIGMAMFLQAVFSFGISIVIGIAFGIYIAVKMIVTGQEMDMSLIENPALLTAISLIFSLLIANTIPFALCAKKLGIASKKLFKKVPITGKEVLIGILITLGVNGIGQAINDVFEFGFNRVGLTSTTIDLGTGMALESILILVSVVILAPITEEYIFRGVLLSGLKQYGERFAVLTTGILFGIIHGNILQGIGAAFIGMTLAVVTLKKDSLLPAIGLHMANNLIVMVLGAVAVSFPQYNWLLDTGLTIILCIIGIVLLVMTRKSWMHLSDEREYTGSRLKALCQSVTLWIVVIIYVVMMITYIKPMA